MSSATSSSAEPIESTAFPITEVPGQRATPEQLSMFVTRYRFLRDYCAGRDVLEIACGGGQGLGYLARVARSVTGGDIDTRVLDVIAQRYADRPNIQVRELDAHALPFPDHSFDVVAILDAIYWMRDQEQCLREARRVLRPGGTLLITTVNKEWAEFCPSPYATHYLNAGELAAFVQRAGFRTSLYAAFETAPPGAKDAVINAVRRVAVALHLIPKSIKYKEMLKRLFFGELTPIPNEVTDDMAPYERPAAVDPLAVGPRFKLLYLVAERE